MLRDRRVSRALASGSHTACTRACPRAPSHRTHAVHPLAWRDRPRAGKPRQFRLSRAYTSIDTGYRTYASGYYYDLAGTDTYEQQLVVVELELYAEQPEVVALTLNRPVPVELCDEIQQRKTDMAVAASDPANTRRAQTGLFLHYTARGSLGVRDKVDNPLDDVGADWALNFGTRHKTVYGAEPVTRLDLLPELACPDSSMTTIGGPPGPT